jgi:hypothetical protein
MNNFEHHPQGMRVVESKNCISAMKKRILFLTTLCLCALQNIYGQGFTEVSSAMGIDMRNNGNSILGLGMSFADFDGDGWDDLTYCSSNDSLVMYRNMGGTGFQRMEIFPFTHDSKMATWVDYDNDGDADLLWTKRNGTTRLFRNEGNMQFTDVTMSLGITQNNLTHIYGCAWSDYDRDGWLDVYICTFSTLGNSRNFLCHNNQDGTFTDLALEAGVTNLASLTFQCAWQDLNGDMWPDLYVINDNDQDNKLYINNQDGTFSDMTASAGVVTNVQSMNISFSDYDHDYDFDMYITDSMDPNILYRNNGDLTFTNVSEEANLEVNSFCWGGTWLDYDHDTWDDIYVATATNVLNNDFFFRNNGDGTFSNAGVTEINSSQLFTYAAGRGDFNNDGFWDISVTLVGDTSYLLYQGIPNTNHWIKLDLEGTFSNRDAIGTHIDYYINGQRHIKYTRCGEGYLTQNSTREILSLGDATQIDSLVITWPRGLVEKIYNLPSDSLYHFVEGENTDYAIQAERTSLCGHPLSLFAGDFASVTWNDNTMNDTLWVSVAGEYSVIVTDSNGYTFTDTITVIDGAAIDYNVTILQPACIEDNTGSATIMTADPAAIHWSDDNESFERNGLAPGTYYYDLSGEGFCSVADSIEIFTAFEIAMQTYIMDVSCYNGNDGSILLTILNEIDSIVWSNNMTGDNISGLIAGTYYALIHYDEVCTYETSVELSQPEALQVTITSENVSCFGGNDGSVSWEITGGILPYDVGFNQGQNTNLSANTYELNITDLNGCQLDSTIAISQPQELVITNAEIVNANNGPNGSITLTVEGGTEPYAFDWSNGSDQSNPSGLGQDDYSVEITDNEGCVMSASYYITDIGIDENQLPAIAIFPNPSSHRMFIRLPYTVEGKVEVWDTMGQLVKQSNTFGLQQLEIATQDLASGNYLLRWTHANGTVNVPFLVEH